MAPHPEEGTGRRDGSGLSTHILPTSATMIGVCLTALYISLLGPPSAGRLLVDKLLALDGLVFLASALLSFLSMRVDQRARRRASLAESVFVGGLGLLALGAVVLALVIS